MTLAQRLDQAALRRRAHVGLGVNLYCVGEFIAASAHFAQACALPQEDVSLAVRYASGGVPYLYYMACTLWMLGYPAQALMHIQEMLTLAQEQGHAYTLARALFFAAALHTWRREWSTAQVQAEAALVLSTEQGFGLYKGLAAFQRGGMLVAQGHAEAGIAQMAQSLVSVRAIGQGMSLSAWLTQLAASYGGQGQAETGLRLLVEALAWMESSGERFYQAEVYRIKGELLLQQAVPHAPQAEACFQQALAVARRQQARSWELRAAVSLCRLWQQQGKCAEAYDMLGPIYGWFTEGFDTADLQEAKALLDALV